MGYSGFRIFGEGATPCGQSAGTPALLFGDEFNGGAVSPAVSDA
jgi:hypothetical protein